MIYLDHFNFPTSDQEFSFFMEIKRKCYDTFYPFQVLAPKSLERLDFEPITILYGGNGSGKTTALNVIAKKLDLVRASYYNKSNFFDTYVDLCSLELYEPLPPPSRIISSDDVFDYMLDLRALNLGIDHKREDLFEEYLDAKYSDFKFNSLADYERLKKVNQARSKTQSKFVRANLMDNVKGNSNGESAFKFFTEHIHKPGLYLLDEPENSLSPKLQLELAEYIWSMARYERSQFIISTHSPFFLAMEMAKIYNLDENPVNVRNWTELEAIKTYKDFFDRYDF